MATFMGEFGDLLPDTISVVPVTRNNYGEAVNGVATTYKARVMHRTQVAMNDKGEEKTTRIQVVINTTNPIAHDSKILLPDGAEETIWSVEVFRDEHNRAHHTVVRL